MLMVARRKYENQIGGEGFIFTYEEMKEFMQSVYQGWLDEMADGIAKEIDTRRISKRSG